jgi:hypothetical protein
MIFLPNSTLRTIRNQAVSLTVDCNGGAFTNFHLNADVNPLSFKYAKEQMPPNNQAGAPYQGHFVCLGQWGEPSEGEIDSGLPNHGHFANILWKADGCEKTINMSVTSDLEGLRMNRNIELDHKNAVVAVEETVSNINPLGRLFNMVQHPTLSRPFLDDQTVINCNAGIGFNQAFSGNPYQFSLPWPLGYCPDFKSIDLRTPQRAYNSIYSFIVDRDSKHGWITAYSPKDQTVLGYIWDRGDYPWIHLWQDWEGDLIRYRAIEFGTAGYHKPFREMIRHPLRLFNEDVCTYLDAGETVTRRFFSFLIKVEKDFGGVKNIDFTNGTLKIFGEQGEEFLLSTGFKEFLT